MWSCLVASEGPSGSFKMTLARFSKRVKVDHVPRWEVWLVCGKHEQIACVPSTASTFSKVLASTCCI